MNGNNILVDTNIALYLLGGDSSLAELLENKNVYVSFITELELLGYKDISELEKLVIEDFLKDCIIIDLNETIKLVTIKLKQSKKVKLPDAIIAATSIYLNIPLISADSGLDNWDELQFIKYEK